MNTLIYFNNFIYKIVSYNKYADHITIVLITIASIGICKYMHILLQYAYASNERI